MSTTQNSAAGRSRETPAANTERQERRAFLFYTNWYDDISLSLTPQEQGEFLLVVVRYASTGEMPGPDVTPVVKTMFGLIRFVLDADLKKYDEMVEVNKQRAKTSADRRRSQVKTIAAENRAAAAAETTSDAVATMSVAAVPTAVVNSAATVATNAAKVVENDASVSAPQFSAYQRVKAPQPIINNQESKISNQKPVEIEKKEEAHPRLEEVNDYWREHGYKSSAEDFWLYYEARGWTSNRGFPLRSWRHAAIMWEDKFRREVLPLRRREAAAEAAIQRDRQAVEAQRIRREERISRETEAEDRAAHAVTREQGTFMYNRARQLANGDEQQALDLLRRASEEPAVFQLLSEGYRPSPSTVLTGGMARER